MRAGKVRPAPVSDDRRHALPYPYKQTPGFEQFRHKVLTARPFAYRAFLDRPFPDPGLRVIEATQRMLPAVHPWGRYTVPYRRRSLVAMFPDRPTLSEATGYYTATGEALGLGDPALGGFFKKIAQKIGKVVQKVIPKEVLKVATIALAPMVAPFARTGILGAEAKKTAIKVFKVAGTAFRIAAPALSFIPGIGVPLAAAASIGGRMLAERAPLTIFRKPLAVFGEAAGAAAFGPSITGIFGMLKGGIPGSPTGNVPTSEILRGESGYELYGGAAAPPPVPSIGWGDVAQTVGTVLTAGADVASQLLRRQQPAPDPGVMYGAPSPGPGSWARDPGTGEARFYPAAGAEQPYVPGSVGYAGAPAEAGPVGAEATRSPESVGRFVGRALNDAP